MNQNILVTGGEGFLGLNLIDFLIHNTDFKIFSISKNKMYTDYSSGRFVSIKHNLLNSFDDKLKLKLKDINYIVHLAGTSDVKKSMLFPVDPLKNDVIATTNLLEFARINIVELKQFLYFGSAEIFGPSKNNQKFKETDPYSPCSPYAVAKAAAQEMCLAYFRSYNFPVVITHIMNIYGKFQRENKFIPKIIGQISSGRKVYLDADDYPTKRNYLHVQDVCAAILFLIDKAPPGEKYNIVSDINTDNLEIAKIIAKILNKKLEYELISPTKKNKHHALSFLDGSKLRELGWCSSIPLEYGLRKFIDNE